MPNPKAIFFDLDETLAENIIPIQGLFANLFSQFQDQLGSHKQEQFYTNLRPRIRGLWNAMFNSNTSPENQLMKAFADAIAQLNTLSIEQSEKLGADMFAHLCHSSANNVCLHTGVNSTLAKLRSAGFITGIITNGIEALQLGKICALDLQEQVDHVVVSAQARAHKPHARVFEFALVRAQVTAEEAWQVGDHATNDVAGAIRAGMSGVFFNPNEKPTESAFSDLEVQPTYTISSIPGILQLLH